MAYNDTPLPTQRPSDSQSEIRDNFTQINNSYGTDHVPFTGSTQGYHKQVTFNAPLAADPGKLGTVASLYTKTVSGNPQLFFQNVSQVIQVTGLGAEDQQSGNIIGDVTGSWYIFSLPVGIKLICGRVNASTSGSFNCSMSGGTFGIGIYAAVSGAFGGGPLKTSFTPTNNSSNFNIQRDGSGPLYFIAITN